MAPYRDENMPTTDRLEMLVNLDEAGARQQIAGLERRPLTVPLELAGGRAGGRMPGGVRGLGGMRVPGMGGAGWAGRMMTGGGAAGMIIGGGFLAGQIFDALTQKGGPSWGQVIASGAAALGMGLMAVPSPYGITQIAGALLIAGGYLGPKLWEYFHKGNPAEGINLGGLLERYKKEVVDLAKSLPVRPSDEDVTVTMPSPLDFGGSIFSERDELAEMQAAQGQEDLVTELRAIRRLLARVVLQGNL